MSENLLLQGDTLRTQEHRGYFPADGKQDLQGSYREHHGGVRG